MGVADELEAARALDRHDLALGQQAVGLGDRVASDRRALGVEQGELGAALGAAVALGVQPAVVRAGVLGLALAAHGEALEAGAVAVVRQVAADGVTRAAVRAVGESVTPAPALAVEHVLQAVAADHCVRADHRRGAAAAAVEDVEVV